MSTPSAIRLARGRLVIAAGLVGALAALSLLVGTRLADRNGPPAPDKRADRLADLLAWIPAADPAAVSFVAWSPDPGEPAQQNALDAFDTYGQLGLDPLPGALGTDPNALDQFGWNASAVTAWAATGGGEFVVLTGKFHVDTITTRFVAAGYEHITYRGQRLLVEPSTATPNARPGSIRGIGAVMVSAERLVIADSPVRLERAIDVAFAGAGSLADQPAVAAALASMAPISMLSAVSQGQLAAACDLNTVAISADAAGRENFALVGYGRLGPGGARRTLVAVSYPSDADASANLSVFASGWQNGYINARGTGARIATYGELTDVSQTGRLLVAELINGRDDGWVRTGIRFALPVCTAAMTLAPAATPDLTGGAGTVPTLERLSNGLPGVGDPRERFRAVDLRGLAAARGVTAPAADGTAVDPWLDGLRPLPTLSILPDDATQLAAWSTVFNIPLADVAGMGEFDGSGGAATVGLVIGDWDVASLTSRLTAIGYATIMIGDVRHFALDPTPADAYPFLSTHPIWSNIALLGDRMWVSSDQRSLRAVLATATDRSTVIVRSATALRPFNPGDLVVQTEGADAITGRCGTVLAGAAGFSLSLSAAAGGTTVRLSILLNGTAPAADLAANLDRRLSTLSIPVPSANATPERGSPVPTSAAQLTEAVNDLGVTDASTSDPPAVVASFAILPAQRPGARFLFTALLESCRLTGLD